jgi:hypothetical protein
LQGVFINMKRLQFLPFILMAGSLVVLGIMFTVRAIGNQRLVAARIQTLTAIAAEVTAASTKTAIPTQTKTPSLEPTSNVPTETVTPFPTFTPEPGVVVEEGCNVALFVADITIPDKTEIYADHKFEKTWRLQNGGKCTWTTKYILYFESGNQMSGPDKSSVIPLAVEPGQSIDISVTLRAPKTAGTYKGFWGLKDQYGNEFGLGNLGKPFYVEIVVVQ